MQQKNIPISILRKFEDIPVYMYKGRFIIAIISALLLLFSSCYKAPADSNALLEAYFTDNVLNSDFIIQFASDSSHDLTGNYHSDTFVLKKDTSFYNGPLIGRKNGVIYTGTWNSNSDYSKLDINITSPAPLPAEFPFLIRSWRFTKKDLPVLQLAPWGSTDPKILYMYRL